MKNKLAAAFHIAAPHTRKASPWIGLATSAIIIATDLKKSR